MNNKKQNRLISIFSTWEEKAKNRQFHIKKYENAKRYKFYLETLFYSYAFIEDILYLWLWNLCVIPNEEKISVNWAKTKKQLRKIYCDYYKKLLTARITLSKVYVKLDFLKSIFSWSSMKNDSVDYYENELLRCLKNVDINKLIISIDEIKKWLSYRNEVTHALLNKNIDDLYKSLPNESLKGYEYNKILYKELSKFKKNNLRDLIRKYKNNKAVKEST